MDYEWDENKRQSNIQKHGKDFADAHKIWESGAIPVDEYAERKGEQRWKTTGKIEKEHCVVVYEDKGDCRRIISFRTATNDERTTYERELGREVGREDDLTRLMDYTEKERTERETRQITDIDRSSQEQKLQGREERKQLSERKDREEYER